MDRYFDAETAVLHFRIPHTAVAGDGPWIGGIAIGLAALWVVAGVALIGIGARTAQAVPSFSTQTSQPCSACHVGSFGPRLKTAGRDFKLYGYTATDREPHFLPITINARSSFTHTDADQSGGAAAGFSDNDNFAFDGVTISYAGRIAGSFGGIARLSYNGIREVWQWGGVDLRYAQESKALGRDLVFGISINSTPGRSDLWEPVPTSGIPFASSGLSRRPKGSPIISSLSNIVAGASLYTLWNETFYVELAAYDGLNRDTLNALGVDPLNGSDSVSGLIPYGRVAFQREFEEGRHFFEIGGLVLHADTFPRDIQSAGSNSFTDVEVDTLYQWIADPALSTSDVFAAHAGFLHERAELDASSSLLGTRPVDELTTFRVDVAYAIDATFTTSLQHFQTRGTRVLVRWGAPTGRVDTRGWIAQLDYVPWGKPDSPVDWLNMRLTLQYLAYEEFNGRSDNASDKNTFFIGFALAGALDL